MTRLGYEDQCRHGNFPDDPNRDGCWTCFDEAAKRGEIRSKDPLLVSPREPLYDVTADGWVEVQGDEPRIERLTPCRAEVWGVDDVLQALRDERELGVAVLKAGIDHRLGLGLIFALKDARRRAHRDDDGRYFPAASIELDDGRIADWEAVWCHNDEQMRHGGHNLHGQIDPHRRSLARMNGVTDGEAAHVDELAALRDASAMDFVGEADADEFLSVSDALVA